MKRINLVVLCLVVGFLAVANSSVSTRSGDRNIAATASNSMFTSAIFVKGVTPKDANSSYVQHFESKGAPGSIDHVIQSDGSYTYVIYDQHGRAQIEMW